MGQHDLPITMLNRDQVETEAAHGEAGEHIQVFASYPAVPWACPESMTVDFELLTARNVTVQSLERVITALAGVPAAARAVRDVRDDPTLFDVDPAGERR